RDHRKNYDDSKNRKPRSFRPSALRSLFLDEFLWLLRIAKLVRVEINEEKAGPVFHSAFAEFLQIRTPPWVLLKVVGNTFGKKDVPGIAAIHHIDPSAGNICLLVKISNFVDWTAVDSHSHRKLWMVLQRLADFQRT